MSWTSPPTKIVEARDLLLALSSVQAAGFVAGSFHYPRAKPSDTLPLCTLERTGSTARRVTNGGTMGGGSITCVFSFAASTADGILEQFVANIADEACSADGDVLWVVDAVVERAGAAGPGLFAADSAGQADQGKAIACIVVVLTWEG